MIDMSNNKLNIKKVGTKGWEYGKAYAKALFAKYAMLDLVFPIMLCVVCLWLLKTYASVIANYLVNHWIEPFPGLFWSVIALVGTYLIMLIVRHRIWKLVLLRTINFYDKYLCIAFATYIVNTLLYFVLGSELWKLYLLASVVSLFFIGIKIQMYRLGKNAAVAKKTNIITLNDLYYNRVPKKGLILLDESAIVTKEEDLLSIVPFVTFMYDMLLKISTRRTHVIGLTGKWGCGKTSIMNLLQQEMQKHQNIVMATFSPWKYEDTYSLFKGFSDFVFEHFDDAFGYISYKEYLRKYQYVLFGYMQKHQGLFVSQFFGNKSTDIAQIREIISEKIKSEDKKMIIVIDDIDRLPKTEILFIFKVIQTIFNFDHLVYVLNFDEERINRIFKEEFATDKNYLDKIIQTKINVPQIDPKAMQKIGKTSMLNILTYHNVRIGEAERLDRAMELILQNFHDLRDLIRYLNSVSATTKNMIDLRLGLDISDVMVLEYIRYADLSLYYQLAQNSCFLISEDVAHSEVCALNMVMLKHEPQFNQQGKSAFDHMFAGKRQYLELLSLVFPNIKAYVQGSAMQTIDSDLESEAISASFLLQRCYSGSFFDVYFTGRDNTFTRLNKTVENFIDEVNFINVDASRQIHLATILDDVGEAYQKLFLKVVQARLAEIKDLDKVFSLTINMQDLYEKYAQTALLLAAIIKKEIVNPQKYLIGLAETDVRMLELVLSELDLPEVDERIVYGRELFNAKLAQESYDIFNKESYKRGTGRLYSSVHYRGDKAKTAQKLSEHVNQENVFRVIAEYIHATSDAESNRQGYYYDTTAARIIDRATIDMILKPGFYELNDDQSKIIKIYEAQGETVIVEAPINFKNI